MKDRQPKRPAGSSDDWLNYAKSDLRLARLAFNDKTIHFEHICFHTQQATEKAIKAVLLAQKIDFPLTHDLEELLEIVENNGISISYPIQKAGNLTPYAVETRYPGIWMEITEAEVEEALLIAEKTILWAKEITSKT